jgi:putative membrane protein insertion efficiency factor
MRPTCRFHPSCSEYAIQALQRHGSLAGSYLTVHRLVRCGPWCQGGEDLVPAEKPRLFSHLFSDASARSPSPSPSPPSKKSS